MKKIRISAFAFGVLICLFFSGLRARAKDIMTNHVMMHNAPAWLTATKINNVTDHIRLHLDWSIHRIDAYYYDTEEAYDKVCSFGPLSLAVTQTDNGKAVVRIGPQVNEKNFAEVFGHELVHVTIYQKYRGAVPKWLEEGLANYFSRAQKVDYKWLAKQPFPDDVRHLSHPMHGSAAQIEYRYMASQAFAEMLARKCDLEELLRLSVTRKMTTYMRTYCEIKHLNEAFHDWVKEKAGGA